MLPSRISHKTIIVMGKASGPFSRALESRRSLRSSLTITKSQHEQQGTPMKEDETVGTSQSAGNRKAKVPLPPHLDPKANYHLPGSRIQSHPHHHHISLAKDRKVLLRFRENTCAGLTSSTVITWARQSKIFPHSFLKVGTLGKDRRSSRRYYEVFPSVL
jgi:hypothetical protein